MTETAINGKDTRCLFINNGDDLLTLKKVVSKKSDKDDVEKQKISKETNGSELNGNHNKTDSTSFDIDNTSSLEPNLEMDSDTDRNITIDSICTLEDRESENIDVSNENSNEADVKNGEKDTEEIAALDSPYSPSDPLDNNDYDSLDLEDDTELNNINSPASYFNISSRAPLHSGNELDSSLENDISPLEDVVINERKRKIEDLPNEEARSSKVFKFWNIMKYPFQKITNGTITDDQNISESTPALNVEDKPVLPVMTAYETDNDDLKTENKITNTDTADDTPENTINKKNLCSIM